MLRIEAKKNGEIIKVWKKRRKVMTEENGDEVKII